MYLNENSMSVEFYRLQRCYFWRSPKLSFIFNILAFTGNWLQYITRHTCRAKLHDNSGSNKVSLIPWSLVRSQAHGKDWINGSYHLPIWPLSWPSLVSDKVKVPFLLASINGRNKQQKFQINNDYIHESGTISYCVTVQLHKIALKIRIHTLNFVFYSWKSS